MPKNVVIAVVLAGIVGFLLAWGGFSPRPESAPVGSHKKIPNLPAPGKNNFWFDATPGRSTVVIFIHGIFSDSRSAWWYRHPNTQDGDVYWPDLVARDDRFDHPNIYLAGFATSMDSGQYDLYQASVEIRDKFESDHVLEGRSRILFVAHSTGGIVARKILFDNPNMFRNKKVGLVLYASPAIGSELANRLSPLSWLYSNRMAEQLQSGSAELRELDKNFRDLKDRLPNDDQMEIRGAEALEHHFVLHHPFLPSRTVVVDQNSGARYFAGPRILSGTDHFTIVKPDRREHRSHEFLVHFYQQQFCRAFPELPSAQAGLLRKVERPQTERVLLNAEKLAGLDPMKSEFTRPEPAKPEPATARFEPAGLELTELEPAKRKPASGCHEPTDGMTTEQLRTVIDCLVRKSDPRQISIVGDLLIAECQKGAPIKNASADTIRDSFNSCLTLRPDGSSWTLTKLRSIVKSLGGLE